MLSVTRNQAIAKCRLGVESWRETRDSASAAVLESSVAAHSYCNLLSLTAFQPLLWPDEHVRSSVIQVDHGPRLPRSSSCSMTESKHDLKTHYPTDEGTISKFGTRSCTLRKRKNTIAYQRSASVLCSAFSLSGLLHVTIRMPVRARNLWQIERRRPDRDQHNLGRSLQILAASHSTPRENLPTLQACKNDEKINGTDRTREENSKGTIFHNNPTTSLHVNMVGHCLRITLHTSPAAETSSYLRKQFAGESRFGDRHRQIDGGIVL